MNQGNTKSDRRIVAVALVTFAMMASVGCASLDPTEDIHRASHLVSTRSGVETVWSNDWRSPSTTWDGHSPLTPDMAARMALSENRSIRRQVEQIVAARSDYVQANLLPNPVINVAIGLPTDGMGGEPLLAGFMQQITWLWRRPAAIDAADARLQQQVLAVSDAALKLVAEVRTAHAKVQFAERALAAQAENVEILAESEALLQQRFSVGESSRLDLNRAALDRHTGEIQLADRQSSLDLAKRELLALLGRSDADAEWSAIESETVASNGFALDESAVIQMAWERRIDVAAARTGIQAHAAAVNLEERARLGEWSAGISYQQNFGDRPGVFPAIQVSPSLFDNNSARIARAESEFRQAVIEADRIGQAAIGEARAAWVALDAQLQVLDSYESQILQLAESNLQLARQAFDAGEADLTALLEAQRLRNVAQIELIDRQLAAKTLHIELERAVGGSLEPLTDSNESSSVASNRQSGNDRLREQTQ